MESLIETIKLIVMCASLLLSLVCVVLYFISKKSKNKQVKEKINNAIDTTQSVLDVLYLVQNAVIGAEKNTHFTNQEKFAYAITSVKDNLIKQNKEIDDTLIQNLMSNELAVSQNVNADERQKAKHSELKKIEIIKEE